MSNLSSTGPSRQLSAILFADVHGYTRSMSKDEEGTYNRVTRSIGLIKSLIGDYGGRVVHTAGDGVLALFDSSTQALSFAVEIQREFRQESVWYPDDDPLEFRIGINMGEVLIGDSDVHGHSVNVAARIQALARPGGICVTETVRRAVHDALGIPMRSLGRRSLKNVAESVEVFAIQVNGPPSTAVVELPSLDQPVQPSTEASIAVLPLLNLSGDTVDNHLCDGLSADLITNLSRFHDLLVIARHSAFLFKNRDIPTEEIGHQLGVRYLLTGDLQRGGSKIRLRVQLIEASSGRVIWAERYNGDLSDVFAFQDDVTDLIAARLAVQISAAERRRMLSEAPPDLRAYGLILRAQDLSLRVAREANLHARRLFEEAADIDPDYARSYAGMSQAFNKAWRFQWTDPSEPSLERAVDLAERAIGLDPSDARGHAALGAACLYKRQHEESLRAYERAAELNPNDADVLAELGHCVSCYGDVPRAVELLQRAMRLNPHYPDWYLWHLGEAHFDLGDYDAAIRTLTRMRDKSEAYRLLTASHALLGRMDEASQYAEELMRTQPEFTLEHWRNVPPDRNPEPRERLIDGLIRAGLK